RRPGDVRGYRRRVCPARGASCQRGLDPARRLPLTRPPAAPPPRGPPAPGAFGPLREEPLPGSWIRRGNLFGIVTRSWQNPPCAVREWSSWVMRRRRTARSLVPGFAADPLGDGGERGA